MARIKKIAYAAAIVVFCLVANRLVTALVAKYNAYLANDTGLTYNKTYPLSLNSYGINSISFTSNVSSVSFQNATFYDGQKSTGTITVTTGTVTNGLAGQYASDYFTVVSTIGIVSTHTMILNGATTYPSLYLEGTTSGTAVNIMRALTRLVTNVTNSTGTAATGGNTVYSSATAAGAGGNNMLYQTNISTNFITFKTYTSSDASGAISPFTGGRDAITVSIAGHFIAYTATGGAGGVYGATATAAAIARAINSDSFLATIVIATNSNSGPGNGSIIYTTSTRVGGDTNYVMTSSSDTLLTIGGSTKTVAGLAGASIGQMWGGANSGAPIISPATTTTIINISTHGLTTGLPVLLSTSGTHTLAPLTNLTTYYVINRTTGSISLALTSTGAVANLAIVITSSNSTTAKTTFTLAPLAFLGVPSFKWQASNDSVTWFDLPVASVTVVTAPFTTGGQQNAWDLANINYAYIRLNVVAPTQGAIRLQVAGNGQ